MSNARFRLFLAAGFIVLLMADGCAAPSSPTQAGNVAPDFRLNDLSGRTVFLNAELNVPVALTFFATWCAPCREEIPLLADLQNKYEGRMKVLCVDVDPENIDRIRSIADGLKIPYPILLDEGRRVMASYSVRELPATFLIGRDGKIVSQYGAFGSDQARALSTEIERITGKADAR
jgi:peroxiredoxin